MSLHNDGTSETISSAFSNPFADAFSINVIGAAPSSPVEVAVQTTKATPDTRPTSAPASHDEVMKPFRDWWYHGKPRPNKEDLAVHALTAFYRTQPNDTEAKWWLAILQDSLQAISGEPTEKLLRDSADAGFAPAMTAIGESLVEHPLKSGDVESGLKWVSDAYKIGDADAAIALGTFAGQGLAGFEKNLRLAETYLREGTARGTMRAHWALTEVLEQNGELAAAFAELTLGANAGDRRCMERLSDTYRKGLLGQQVDPAQCVLWMKAACEYGSAPMQRQMAKVLTTGYSGVVVNLTEARRMIELAADASDKEAMYMLADGSLTGRYGYAVDPAKSGDLLGRLVKENYPPAMYLLARAHLEGRVRSNTLTHDEAMRQAEAMLEKAAKMGYAPALRYQKERDPTSPL